jgi:hypothetical protein
MNAHELLLAARTLIQTPNDWTKGVNARDAAGEPVEEYHPNAVCYCALGAVDITDFRNGADSREYWRSVDALNAAVPAPYQHWEVHEYQDLPETTHADVLALFDRAIAATAPEAV